MKTEDRRVCPSCGNEFSGAVEFCPVCMLHGALADDVESGESSSERVTKPKSHDVARRFQHYELLIDEDGRPVELGRGAMGVTYKAFDVDLRCPVTLKVISEKYLGDESARLRFLREARAAASVEQLEDVPQPVVSLIEVLLDKDPKRRFQAPAELLKALPTIRGAIDEGRTITYQRLGQMPDGNSYSVTRKPPGRLGPEKISVARLPITGSDLFGREEDIAFLNDAWASPDVNVATIVAWAGVGKSTLVNHWLRGMAARHYDCAELVYGWSFYRQGTSGGTSSADEFLDAALTWFGDPDPRMGTAWEKGERLAKLIAHRRTLLVLDGLEPLQNPPGPQEGRVRDPSLQALLRELAAFNSGLCVITTRLPIADVADHERTSAPRRDLEQLSSDAGAKLLRALGVKGGEAELRSASDEFNGHCLALTLLGSYLTDAYNGDIRCRKEVSERLSHDVRQGAHARKVMESYQSWLGEGPELSVLRMLGLFDRPADEKALGVLLKSPAIPGLTESLTGLSPSEWRTILARLRRARLSREKIRTILDTSIRILLFVNTLENNFAVNERTLGRNATGGSTITIERLRLSCRIV